MTGVDSAEYLGALRGFLDRTSELTSEQLHWARLADGFMPGFLEFMINRLGPETANNVDVVSRMAGDLGSRGLYLAIDVKGLGTVPVAEVDYSLPAGHYIWAPPGSQRGRLLDTNDLRLI